MLRKLGKNRNLMSCICLKPAKNPKKQEKVGISIKSRRNVKKQEKIRRRHPGLCKKKALTLEKKAQKALQSIKKKQSTEKKAQKSTSFKSTHYDPCKTSLDKIISIQITLMNYNTFLSFLCLWGLKMSKIMQIMHHQPSWQQAYLTHESIIFTGICIVQFLYSILINL